jgi:xylulokinase
VTPRVTEAAALGAALLGGMGVGLYTSAAAASARCLRMAESYAPDPDRHERYTRQYDLYRQVYPAVAPISHQL